VPESAGNGQEKRGREEGTKTGAQRRHRWWATNVRLHLKKYPAGAHPVLPSATLTHFNSFFIFFFKTFIKPKNADKS
jgi:hypothetical protein